MVADVKTGLSFIILYGFDSINRCKQPGKTRIENRGERGNRRQIGAAAVSVFQSHHRLLGTHPAFRWNPCVCI